MTRLGLGAAHARAREAPGPARLRGAGAGGARIPSALRETQLSAHTRYGHETGDRRQSAAREGR